MEEKEAIELLEKLEKFMRDTNESIKTLSLRIYNLQVDMEKLKKHMAEKNRIIVSN